MLEFEEEIFDFVALFVEFLVVSALDFSVRFWWDDGGNSCGGKRRQHTFIGIIGFIGEERRGGNLWQKRIGALQIMRLPRRQKEAGGVAERVARRMNLGGQPAFAAADGLAALFLRAPALC